MMELVDTGIEASSAQTILRRRLGMRKGKLVGSTDIEADDPWAFTVLLSTSKPSERI